MMVTLLALVSLALPKMAFATPIDPPYTVAFLSNKDTYLDANEGKCYGIKAAANDGLPDDLTCKGSIQFTDTDQVKQVNLRNGDCAVPVSHRTVLDGCSVGKVLADGLTVRDISHCSSLK